MRERDRDEWVRLNTCRFCVGSHLHSCTGYRCEPAIKEAEEYFKRRMKMKIGLIDVDSHNYPNIPLMKISAWHKRNGDNVEFAIAGKRYDKVYMSKIFTESKEPEGIVAETIVRGGSGYDLKNRLPDEMEHIYPEYSLYPELTAGKAFGMLTRGCPRCNHGFCITPQKDGIVSRKVADLSEFWNSQKKIILLDQNILACKDRMELLHQLAESKAEVDFNGGCDIRFMTDEIIDELKKVKVKDYHFAWDDPRENLEQQFRKVKESGLKNPDRVRVYVLTNYWSSIEEDLHRIYTLRKMGFVPFVMIYDKQKFVDKYGRWLPSVGERYTREQMIHFKICQHMQRWSGTKGIIKLCPDFNDYEPVKKWREGGRKVPEEKVEDRKRQGGIKR